MYYPTSQSDHSRIEEARNLVAFHRNGFGVDDDGWISDIYIKYAVSYATTTWTIIAHYAACLRCQCQLEEEHFDGENQLRKQ